MRIEQIGNATLYLGTMEETIGGIERVDHIFSDPPYLYIKTHDFDRPWDEQLFFENAKRLLPDSGFIALFGRGTSFYRWNTRLAELGFVFKEEIVWNKMKTSGVAKYISRVHETISIYTKKNGSFSKIRIPYEEARLYDFKNIEGDLRRLVNAFEKPKGIEKLKKVIQEKKIELDHPSKSRFGISFAKERMAHDSSCERVFIIENGMLEKTIIPIGRTHYNAVHPTQKPVRLAERIIALISNPDDTIYDPFMGSGSFGVACINAGRKYIGSEMKPEYFDIACKRIAEANKQGDLFREAG
jgi:site-specific DNA-methyltransferase (adenine-specific)